MSTSILTSFLTSSTRLVQVGTNVPTHIYYLIVISALGMPPALYVATAAKLIKVTAKTIKAAVTTFVNMVFCVKLLVPYWQYKYTTYIVTTKTYMYYL